MGVKTILNRYGRLDVAPLGGERDHEIDRAAMAADVKRAMKRITAAFIVCYLAGLVVFGILVYSALQGVGVSTSTRVTSGACGVTLFGLLAWLRRQWREKTALDMLIALVPVLDDATLRTVANRMLVA